MASVDFGTLPLGLNLLQTIWLMDSAQTQSAIGSSGDTASTAGYAAIVDTAVTKSIPDLNDSVILSRLTERVYELLLEDMRKQQERVKNYGRGWS